MWVCLKLINLAKEGRKLVEYHLNDRMSGMVWGKTFPTKYVMSDDINDIQDPRYQMRRRTFFEPVNVLCTWVCMHLDGCTC